MKSRYLLPLITTLVVVVPASASAIASSSSAAHYVRVPNVKNSSLRQAERAIHKDHLRVGRLTYRVVRRSYFVGRIIATKPIFRQRARWGTRIRLYVGAHPLPKKQTSPGAPSALVPTLGTIVGVGITVSMTNALEVMRWYKEHQNVTLARFIVRYDRDLQWVAERVAMARQLGLKVELVVQWGNKWSNRRIQDRFRSILRMFPSPSIYAVGVGNEQDLRQGGGKGETPAQYASQWRAVEPILVQLAPRAIRIAIEATPWSVDFAQQAFNAGLPGAQALGAHPYKVGPHCGGIGHGGCGITIDQWRLVGAAVHMPLWFDDCLYLPLATDNLGNVINTIDGNRSLDELWGAAMVGAFLKPPAPAPPASVNPPRISPPPTR